MHLPTDPQDRKKVPLFSGLVKYFPDALVAVAKLSQKGNDQHNPGKPLHWSREKSSDHEDTLMRHLFDSADVDVDGVPHCVKVAWRALAIAQLYLEKKEKDAEPQVSEDVERPILLGKTKQYAGILRSSRFDTITEEQGSIKQSHCGL